MDKTYQQRIVWVGIIAVVATWLILLPGGEYVNVFRSVGDNVDSPEDILYRQQAARGGKPQYILHHGRLYLETVRLREGWLADWVSYRVLTTWTADDIARLRRAHPELETKWPDPSLRNGGVEWVTQE